MPDLSFNGSDPARYVPAACADTRRTEFLSALFSLHRDRLSLRDVRPAVPGGRALARDQLSRMRSASGSAAGERIDWPAVALNSGGSRISHRIGTRRPGATNPGMMRLDTQHDVEAGGLTSIAWGVNSSIPFES
jgi:hypothetical protein